MLLISRVVPLVNRTMQTNTTKRTMHAKHMQITAIVAWRTISSCTFNCLFSLTGAWTDRGTMFVHTSVSKRWGVGGERQTPKHALKKSSDESANSLMIDLLMN